MALRGTKEITIAAGMNTTHRQTFAAWREDVREKVARALQPGDLVFIDLRGAFLGEVGRAQGNPLSHVGIAFRDPDHVKDWVIAEATALRAKEGPLEAFHNRAWRGRIAVFRLMSEPMDAKSVERLHEAARKRLGMAYDPGFDLDRKDRSFCSKLVYECFADALDVKLGRIVTFKTLLHEHHRPRVWPWWIVFAGRIPWRRRTITPASIIDDPKIREVFDSGYPTAENPLRRLWNSVVRIISRIRG